MFGSRYWSHRYWSPRYWGPKRTVSAPRYVLQNGRTSAEPPLTLIPGATYRFSVKAKQGTKGRINARVYIHSNADNTPVRPLRITSYH